MKPNWVQKSILAWLRHHFHLALDGDRTAAQLSRHTFFNYDRRKFSINCQIQYKNLLFFYLASWVFFLTNYLINWSKNLFRYSEFMYKACYKLFVFEKKSVKTGWNNELPRSVSWNVKLISIIRQRRKKISINKKYFDWSLKCILPALKTTRPDFFKDHTHSCNGPFKKYVTLCVWGDSWLSYQIIGRGLIKVSRDIFLHFWAKNFPFSTVFWNKNNLFYPKNYCFWKIEKCHVLFNRPKHRQNFFAFFTQKENS